MLIDDIAQQYNLVASTKLSKIYNKICFLDISKGG